jgi:hypothetical protein
MIERDTLAPGFPQSLAFALGYGRIINASDARHWFVRTRVAQTTLPTAPEAMIAAVFNVDPERVIARAAAAMWAR